MNDRKQPKKLRLVPDRPNEEANAAGRSLPEPCYFGDCPFCGGTDGYMNIGRGHWFVCDKHRLKWCADSNLFSSWREEDEMTWERNARRIACKSRYSTRQTPPG